MKKLSILFIIAVMAVGTVLGQSHREDIDIAQSIYGKEKKAIVKEYMSDQANFKFWDLYDRYEAERKELNEERAAIISSYSYVMNSHDIKMINRLVKAADKNRAQMDKLIYKYYNKIKHKTSTEAAANFYQMEHFFLGEIRALASEVLPVVAQI